MTVKKQVEEKLRRDGSASNFWAIDNRITTRLSDVILKLKREGWEFSTESGYVGDSKNWKYVMLSAPKSVQLTL